MNSPIAFVEPEAGELTKLAALYMDRCEAEQRLAASLAASDLHEAADNNRTRAQIHRRTAGILAWLASFEGRRRA